MAVRYFLQTILRECTERTLELTNTVTITQLSSLNSMLAGERPRHDREFQLRHVVRSRISNQLGIASIEPDGNIDGHRAGFT